MTKKVLSTAAISALAIGLLTGCQSITDQIAQKAAQSMVNQATGGQVSMSGGANGTINITGNGGNLNIGGQRSANVPADMPNLPGATGYTWFGSSQGGIFGFTVNTDYQSACNQMTALVKAAGWSVNPNGFNMSANSTVATMYQKTGYDLVLSCSSKSNTSSVVTMTKSANNNQSTSGSSQSASGG